MWGTLMIGNVVILAIFTEKLYAKPCCDKGVRELDLPYKLTFNVFM